LEWQDATQPHLTDVERQFLAASVAHAASETRATADRARLDARQNRRLRSLLAATAILLAAAIIVGAVAIRQRERAQNERRVATARELAAAANANLDIDAERSVLLALAAVEQTRSADGTALPEAEEALHRAITANWLELRVPGWAAPSTGARMAMRSRPRASTAPASWTSVTRAPAGHPGTVEGVAFSADGSRLATASSDGTILLWDARSGEQQLALRGHPATATSVSFSPDGSQLASVGLEGIVRIWALDLDELVEIARARLTRELTDEECREYLHAERCPDLR
jgi:hypothetical protein